MKESNVLEFKETLTDTFLKTVSAFANYEDGEIKFGITDDGKEVGVKDPDEVCSQIENKINDSFNPRPTYTLDVNRRTKVITLKVEEGLHKPYWYKGKAYIRNETSTVEVDSFELKRLALEGSNMNYEELPSKREKLTFKVLEGKLKEKLDIEEINDDILKTLGLYDRKGRFNLAAELLSDENGFFGIDIARFGDSINDILDRVTIQHKSIISQYNEAIDVYRRYYQFDRVEGFYRNTKEKIPEEAFREAVANALIHRVWDVNGHTRIAMYDDRIEITSFGGLPKGFTKNDYLKDRSSSFRNPILASVFSRLGYIEMFGTGVRKIVDAYSDSGVSPYFDITDSTIMIILPVLADKPSMTIAEETVYGTLDNGRQLASSEIAEKTGFSRDKVIRILNSLKEYKYIEAIGNGRGTKYKK